VSPSPVIANTAANLTVNGSGFVSSTTAAIDGTAASSALVSANQLTVNAPALTAGSHSLTVTNGSPGGGTATTTLTVNNPAPAITSIQPDPVVTGSPATLTVTGSGFIAGAAVTVDSTTVTYTLNSATQITVNAGTLNSGSHTLTVTNGTPGGGSASKTFLAGSTKPVPAITAISPDPAPSAGGTLTVTGTGFLQGITVVTIDGTSAPYTAASSTQMSVTSPPLAVASHTLTVMNPAPGGGTASKTFNVVNYPTPTITTISPDPVVAGSPAVVTVTGTGFVQGVTAVTVDGTSVTYTFTSSSQINVNAGSLTAGTHTLATVNPAPGGGTATKTFGAGSTKPAPAISAISPNPVPSNTVTTITVTGSGFVQNVTTAQIDGQAATSNVTLSTQMTVNVPSLSLSNTHVLSITNPSPGGGTANLTFATYTNPVPTITSTSPGTVASPVPVNVSTNITVVGTGFVTSSTVLVDGSSSGVSVVASSTTSMTVTVGPLTEATHTLTVTNPAPGGGTITQSFIASPPLVTMQVTIRDVYTGAALPNTTFEVNQNSPIVSQRVSMTTNSSGVAQITVPAGPRLFHILASGYLERRFTRPIAAQFQYAPFNSMSTIPFTMRVYPSTHSGTPEVDSDGDGLPDRVETNTGIFMSIDDTGTDPHNVDSDGDGLDDGTEILDGPEVAPGGDLMI